MLPSHTSFAVTDATVGRLASQLISTLVGKFDNVGATVLDVHVTVRERVAVLPQPSVANHVLVSDLAQPVLPIGLSVCVNDCRLQLAVADASPSVNPIVAVDGLQPIAVAKVQVG